MEEEDGKMKRIREGKRERKRGEGTEDGKGIYSWKSDGGERKKRRKIWQTKR